MVWFSLDGDWFLLFLSLLVSVFNWFLVSGVFEFLSLLESGGAKSPLPFLHSSFYNEEEFRVLWVTCSVMENSENRKCIGLVLATVLNDSGPAGYR